MRGAARGAQLGLGLSQGELERTSLLQPGALVFGELGLQTPLAIGIILLRLDCFRSPSRGPSDLSWYTLVPRPDSPVADLASERECKSLP